MTTVAVTRHGGKLLMAADTTSEMDGRAVPAASKVWLQRGSATPVLFGAAGAGGARYAVARHVKIDGAPVITTHDNPDADDQWDAWAAAIAESVMSVLAGATPSLVDGNDPEASLLLAAADRFWLIAGLAAQPVYRESRHFAIGSGADTALGWLEARPGDVTGAIRAATRWDTYTRLGASGRPLLMELPTATAPPAGALVTHFPEAG